jgi:hypothetical protein
MAETACPSCGYGPLDAEADDCPKCSTRFAANPLYKRVQRAGGHGQRKDAVDLEATRTVLGALTGAVDAHPLPAAAVLVLSTAAWILRCVGFLTPLPQPTWPLVIAAAQMGVAMLLALVSGGPGKPLAQMLSIAQIAAGYLAGGSSVTRLGFTGAGVALLAMTLGEPGDIRRLIATGAAVAMLGFGVWGVVTAG